MHLSRQALQHGGGDRNLSLLCFPSGAPPPAPSAAASPALNPVPGDVPARQKRQGPDHRRPHQRGYPTASYAPQLTHPSDGRIIAMSKLLFQHEDRFNFLQLDRVMVMFLKEDSRSVLLAMMKAS